MDLPVAPNERKRKDPGAKGPKRFPFLDPPPANLELALAHFRVSPQFVLDPFPSEKKPDACTAQSLFLHAFPFTDLQRRMACPRFPEYPWERNTIGKGGFVTYESNKFYQPLSLVDSAAWVVRKHSGWAVQSKLHFRGYSGGSTSVFQYSCRTCRAQFRVSVPSGQGIVVDLPCDPGTHDYDYPLRPDIHWLVEYQLRTRDRKAGCKVYPAVPLLWTGQRLVRYSRPGIGCTLNL